MKLFSIIRRVLAVLNRPDPVQNAIRIGAKIGKRFNMMNEVWLDGSFSWLIEIGDDVTIAPRVYILAHDASTKLLLGYTRIGKVTIGDRVFIGASAIVLPGVTIGSDVVIAAGSVVTRDVPDGVVVAGNPAREICKLDQFKAKRKAEMEGGFCFDETYTVDGGITDVMKEDMISKMKNRVAYIV